MLNTSAAWPLNEAIAAIVESDTELQTMLAAPYIYSTMAPKDAPLNYLVLADTTEDPRNTFGRGGNQCLATIHIWHKEIGQEGPLRIYGRLVELFRGQAIAVTGHTVYRCTVRLVGVIRDPSNVMHGVVELTALVMNG